MVKVSEGFDSLDTDWISEDTVRGAEVPDEMYERYLKADQELEDSKSAIRDYVREKYGVSLYAYTRPERLVVDIDDPLNAYPSGYDRYELPCELADKYNRLLGEVSEVSEEIADFIDSMP